MGQFRTILQETRDEIYQMKCESDKNWIDQIQYSCQLWNLDRMLDIANGIHKLRNRIRNKQR